MKTKTGTDTLTVDPTTKGFTAVKVQVFALIAAMLTCGACGSRAAPLPDPPVVRARDGLAEMTLTARRAADGRDDLHTFRVCCRIVRGFDLTDAQALDVLREWNGRCEPPWTDRELQAKIANAARYGREARGSLV